MTARHRRGGKSDAETWLRTKDNIGARIILAELAESAGRANALLARALDILSTNPDQAMKCLVDLEIQLEHFVRPELEDTLSFVREGIDRLAAELPGDESEDESRPSVLG